MLELRASIDNFQQLEILHRSCVNTCIDLMMYGTEPYWLDCPDSKELNIDMNEQILFCFRL